MGPSIRSLAMGTFPETDCPKREPFKISHVICEGEFVRAAAWPSYGNCSKHLAIMDVAKAGHQQLDAH